MRDGDRALLQTGDRFGNFPRRTRMITTLNRAIQKRSFFIKLIFRSFLTSFGSPTSHYKRIRIKTRRGSHRHNFPVIRVHCDYHPALCRRIGKLFFRRHLQIEINCRNQILSGLRLDDFNLTLDASATVNDYFSITGRSAQIFVVILLKTAFADNISGTKAFFLHFRFFKLFRTDFADITERVRQRRAKRIKSLRLNLDAEFGIFEFV